MIPQKLAPKTILLAFLCLLPAACTTGPGVARDDYYTYATYPQVSMIQGLKWVLLIDKPVVTNAPDKPMSVTVPVRTETLWKQNIQYRFTFFDKDHRPLEPRMEWRTLQLPRHLQEFAQGSALDTAAVDWRLEFISTDAVPPL